MSLEPKEEAFVSAYIRDTKCNATKAAIAAGYSKRSARQIASTLLSKHDIKEEIKKRQAKVAEKSEVSAARLDSALISLAEADIRQAFNPDGTIRSMAEMPDDVAKAISSVEVDQDGNVVKFKFVEKVRPIELLLKRQSLLVDRHEHTGKDGKPLVAPVTLDMSNVSDKTLDRLADILADAPPQ